MEFVAEGAKLFLTFAAVTVAVVSSTFLLIRARLRYGTGLQRGAPTRWLIGVGAPAVLHRRLRAVTASVRMTIPPPRWRSTPTKLQELATDIERLAIAIDSDLIRAASSPKQLRRRDLGELSARVEHLEGLSQRLIRTAVHLDPATISAAEWRRRAIELDSQISSFEQAREELSRFDPDELTAFWEQFSQRRSEN